MFRMDTFGDFPGSLNLEVWIRVVPGLAIHNSATCYLDMDARFVGHLVRITVFYKILYGMSYCKRGYFRWGKISRKCWQDVSRGGNFHDSTHISFIKTYGFYFRVGVIFAKKTKSRKTRKLPPRENFHVYSTSRFHMALLEQSRWKWLS